MKSREVVVSVPERVATLLERHVATTEGVTLSAWVEGLLGKVAQKLRESETEPEVTEASDVGGDVPGYL